MTTRLSRHIVHLGGLAALFAGTVLVGCGPPAPACADLPREGAVDRTVIVTVDTSQSGQPYWPTFVDQTLDVIGQVADSEETFALHMFAMDNSVMTGGSDLLGGSITFNFDVDGNETERGDYVERCIGEISERLDRELEAVEGSDPFGAIEYANELLEQADTENDLFVMLGDGLSTTPCNLYAEDLSDPAHVSHVLDRCTQGDVPEMAAVSIYQGGVGLRPDGSPDNRADALLDLYETFWSSTDATDFVVAPTLNTEAIR